MTDGHDIVPHIGNVDELPTAVVPINSLLTADSPRSAGESREHIRMLAESVEHFPPLVVHRPTMRVIDGMHRFRAARLRGEKEIGVRFYDGDEASAFVLAVQSNITHGLPLSLADRKSAAARILSSYPHWSDRFIASVSGLSPGTIGAIRAECPTGKNAQSDSRIGRDGRRRPVDAAALRVKVAELISGNPEASLRDIARKAGVSHETVRNVRNQLTGEKTPVMAGGAYPHAARERADGVGEDRRAVPQVLWQDPALRSREHGRSLLRLLSAPRILEDYGEQMIEVLPPHCISKVAEGARACAAAWTMFSERIERLTNSLISTAGRIADRYAAAEFTATIIVPRIRKWFLDA
jgi:ParB-like chromosome segregation protein Spo0J